MPPSSLHALIIDRHFGELSPEAAELLELHLAGNADARAEAQRILRALAVTQKTIMQHPELARVASVEKAQEPPLSPAKRLVPFLTPWLARAAAVLLLAALTGAGGFLAGRSSTASSTTAAVEAPVPSTPPRKESPWARYRMAFDPAGQGMQVVRVDTAHLQERSIP